jgi:hypothetical protein
VYITPSVNPIHYHSHLPGLLHRIEGTASFSPFVSRVLGMIIDPKHWAYDPTAKLKLLYGVLTQPSVSPSRRTLGRANATLAAKMRRGLGNVKRKDGLLFADTDSYSNATCRHQKLIDDRCRFR